MARPQQVGLLGFEDADNVGVTRIVPAEVVTAEFADSGDPGAGGVVGGGAIIWAVVLGEQGVQVPGDGGWTS